MFKTMEDGRLSQTIGRRLRTLVILLSALHGCTTDAGVDRDLDSLFQSARLAMWQGRLAEAGELAEHGIEVAGSQADSHRSWKLRLLLGEILINRLDFTRASTFLAANIPSAPSFDDLHGRQKYLQAKMLVADGKLAEALVVLDGVKAAAPATEEAQLDAEILAGQVRFRLGQWDEAERGLGDVLKRTDETKDRHRAALALINLGMGRLVRGRYDEALAWFERVLSYTDLEEMAAYGTALYNAGICYSRVGEFERATEVQHRAVEIYERRGPSLQLVQSLGSLGNTYVLQGDARRALPFLQRAMNVAIAAKLTDDSALWAGNLASAYAELREWSEAERFNDEAIRLGVARRTVKPVHFTLNAANIALGRGDLVRAATLFEKSLTEAEGTAAVTWSAHAGLARVATAAGQPQRAAGHFEAALRTIETTRSSLLKPEFRLSFLTQLIEFYQIYVEALLGQNRIERALEITESSRGRVLAEGHDLDASNKVDANALRRLAQQSGTVLLSYWLAPTRSSLWIIDRDAIRYVALPPAGEIEALVQQHQAMIHTALADPLAKADTPGDRLYELLVAPVARWIKPGSAVLIAPDGALHRLNFETLPVGGARRRYWIEDAEIQIAPSLTMLTTLRKTEGDRRSLLIIGDAPGRDAEFPALRYAAAEMANVSRHFPADKVMTYRSDRAIPGAYRLAQPDRFAMIHFTAHAVANPESPLDSAIMLSGPDHAHKLYARDVADERLTADLVTVSACRSAGARTYSGEGLVGFAWAFLRAGARRVIAGLWDVDDRSTADLMDQVYARIASGVSPPRALREAKLAALRRGGTVAKPYYWAPFEVFTITTSN